MSESNGSKEVMGPGQVRYLKTGHCDECDGGWNKDGRPHCRFHHIILERIAGWPAPGPSPQFITNDLETFVNPQDVFAYRDAIGEITIARHRGPSGYRLGALKEQNHAIEAWLVARVVGEEV